MSEEEDLAALIYSTSKTAEAHAKAKAKAKKAKAKAKAKTDAAAADKEKGQTNASSVSVERTVNIGRKNRTTTAFRRVGRSDANVRVSNVVIPQARPPTRVRASAVEGKRVMVTGGEFRGLSGTISSCIPDGWYLVSNLYEDDQHLDVLIHSGNLQLVADASRKKTPAQQGHISTNQKSSI